MRLAHVGDEAPIGARHLAELGDLPEPAHAHFHDDRLGVVGSEQRVGHAELVVLIGLGGHHAHARRQNVAHEVLGRRLARRAGEGDDEPFLHEAPFLGDARQRARAIVHEQYGRARVVGGANGSFARVVRREHGSRPVGDGGRHEVVAVNALPFERHVQAPRRNGAGIPRHA